MNKNMDSFTDDEIVAELDRRQTIQQQEQQKTNRINAGFVLQQVDTLLLLVTKHDTMNCCDDNLASAYIDKGSPRCRRCRLLQIKEDGCNNNVGLNVRLIEL